MVIYGINTNMASAKPINIIHSGSWEQTKDVYIMHSGAWQQVKNAWIMDGGAWREIYDYQDHETLYGTSNYKFTPTGTAGGGSGVVACEGMPCDYNSSTYGTVIWAGWVGILVYPTGSYIDLKFTADNSFTMHANQTQVLSGNNWGVWYTKRITTIAGDPLYISASLANSGGPYGFAGHIKNEDGSYLTKTSFSWVSA